MNKTRKIILAAIVLLFIVGAYLYPGMPDLMASHWGADGRVNGYLPKFWALFFVPVITLVTFLLLIFVPKIDPLKANYAKFQKYYDGFLAVFVAFMVYIYALTALFNKGIEFDMTMAIMPAMAILFWFTGVVLENAKQNWFIGIRTPWTMSSEKVWDKTNKLAAKIFKMMAILALLLIFMGESGFAIFITAVLILSFWPIIYSYLEFRKEALTLDKK